MCELQNLTSVEGALKIKLLSSKVDVRLIRCAVHKLLNKAHAISNSYRYSGRFGSSGYSLAKVGYHLKQSGHVDSRMCGTGDFKVLYFFELHIRVLYELFTDAVTLQQTRARLEQSRQQTIHIGWVSQQWRIFVFIRNK